MQIDPLMIVQTMIVKAMAKIIEATRAVSFPVNGTQIPKFKKTISFLK